MTIKLRQISQIVAVGVGLALAIGPTFAEERSGQRICGLHSSILLVPGEQAEIVGAGSGSVSMRINGPAGAWIFYDGLSSTEDPAAGSVEILRTTGRIAYRRNFDARIYTVRPVPAQPVGGKFVEAAAMGIDMARLPLDHPAITGSNADLAVIKRVYPGEMSGCNLRWLPGTGLVEQTR